MLVALLTIAPLLAGGCTLYSNPSACKAQMREAAGKATPPEKLSISHVGVGIHGSRVVVEGTLEAAAAPTANASDASGASAPHPKAKPVAKPASAECTFEGNKLQALHWFAPPELANPPAPAKG
ncbi:hypothetical protein DWV00_19445 [Trinickia dinghuensis]|uniref:Uncharacterized protein n=2 Tax=Trinickia dinghuensis TaxID=2291023 RepID=A0A3D8JX62_9BURK|nr:hypothetical protein DWV00_19445 [Trinickia dinghuensis]